MTKAHHRGHFVWRELLTPDIDASKAFYGALFNWSFDDQPMPWGEGTYPIIMAGERGLGGLVSLATIGNGAPPHWTSYVSVANVDETAAAAKANGGSVSAEPMNIPSVGRMSVIADAQHAATSNINFEPGDPTPEERPSVGTFCWEQLNTSDVNSAVAFYQKVYGWEQRAFEGGGNIVTLFAGERPVASVMQAPAGVPAHWLTYVVVENLAASREQVKELGGKVMVDTIPVPTIGTLSVITDVHGAVIGLFEPSAA